MAKRVVEVLLKAVDETKKATDSAGKNLEGLQKKLAVMSKAAAVMGASIVAAFTAASVAVYKYLSSVAKAEDALAKAAQRAQVSVKEFAEWAFVLQRASRPAGDYEDALSALSRQMGVAGRGVREMQDAFVAAGVVIRDSSGNLRKASDVYDELVHSLQDMEDEAKKSYLAQLLLGDAGKFLIPILNEQAESVDEVRLRYNRLGGTAIVAATDVAEAWVDAQLDVKTAVDGVHAAMLSTFGPEIVKIIEAAAWQISDLRQLFEDWPKPENEGWSNFFINIGRTAGTATAVAGTLVDWLTLIGSWKVKDEGAFRQLVADLTETNNLTEEYLARLWEIEGVQNRTRIDVDQIIAENKKRLAQQEAMKAIAEDRADSYKEALEISQELKESTAAELEGHEAVTNNIFGRLILYDDILAAEAAVAEAAKEQAEYVEAFLEKLRALADGLSFGILTKSIEGTEDSLKDTIDAADALGNSVARAAGSGVFDLMKGEAVDLGRVLVNSVVRALEQIIIKLIAIKTIQAFASVPFLSQGGTVPGMARGGSIPKAAAGYSVPDGPRGRDSRLIMAMPGEEVINRKLSQRLNRFITAQEQAAYASPYGATAAPLGGGTVVLNVGIPESRAGLQRMQDAIETSLQRGGEI